MTGHNHPTREIRAWPSDCDGCNEYNLSHPGKRVLITGSRDWTDTKMMARVLRELLMEIGPYRLVHGDARGADTQGAQIADFMGLPSEPHPANWRSLGKRAGFVRNAEMVDLGADICVAFIKDGSKGATMCADLAEKAGIPTRRYTA